MKTVAASSRFLTKAQEAANRQLAGDPAQCSASDTAPDKSIECVNMYGAWVVEGELYG